MARVLKVPEAHAEDRRVGALTAHDIKGSFGREGWCRRRLKLAERPGRSTPGRLVRPRTALFTGSSSDKGRGARVPTAFEMTSEGVSSGLKNWPRALEGNTSARSVAGEETSADCKPTFEQNSGGPAQPVRDISTLRTSLSSLSGSELVS